MTNHLLQPAWAAPAFEGFVFDLDGTLIDSAPDILRGLRQTFADLGVGLLPQDYRPAHLPGTIEAIMQAMVDDMGWSLPCSLAEVKAAFGQRYAALPAPSSALYPGVAQVLAAIHATGRPMGICTNTTHASAVAIAQRLGIAHYFGCISGLDSWAQSKPSPEPLLRTLSVLGVAPERSLYVGDTLVDLQCAEAAGVPYRLHGAGYGRMDLPARVQRLQFSHWNEWLVGANAAAEAVA